MNSKKRLSSKDAQDRILLAAARAFRTHGMGTTVDQIAEEANYSTSALYKHFANREAILDALGDRAYSKIFALFAAGIPEDLTFEQRLRWLMGRMTDFALEDPDFYLAVLAAAPAIRASGDPRRYKREEDHLGFFVDQMKEGLALGAMSPQFSALQLGLAFRGMMDSLGALWVQMPETDLKKMADVSLDLFLHGAVNRS